MGYVYMIQNIINNKIYVGSTINYDKRQKAHIRSLRGGYHDNRLLQQDFDLYGEDSFKIKQLCETNTEAERFDIEASLISTLRTYENGYNLSVDGRGKYIITDKTRLKMSENSTGNKNPFYGKTHTTETRKILSDNAKKRVGNKNPFYGKKHTEESKDKAKSSYNKLKSSGWVNTQKGVPKSEEAKLNNAKAQPSRKPIHVEGKNYMSVSECAKELGVARGTIRNRINSEKYPNYYYIND